MQEFKSPVTKSQAAYADRERTIIILREQSAINIDAPPSVATHGHQ